MSVRSGTPGLQDLIGRAAWARRLARQLVRQDAEADDLLQETWLVAAEKAPEGEAPSRRWLAGVLRVLGMRGARAAGRRRQREAESAANAAAVPPEAVARPDDLLEQVETTRRLSEALLALAEPYRTAVLLRYYEELSAAEIARRTAVPAGTVRWRVKEGLDRLRRELDDRAGGRRAWALALARFVAREPVARGVRRVAIAGGLTAAGLGLVGIAALVAGPPRAPQPRQGLSALQGNDNDPGRQAPRKEANMKTSIGVLAVAASLAAHPDSGAMAAAPRAIPPSKVPRFWAPLGVGPVKGPPTARVTILAFMDYQSPFCLRASQTMDALVAAHAGEVRYQVIHRPLPFHRQAPFAAKAALAAGQQGKFWEMHEVLLANHTALGPADIEGYAKKLGLDLARFQADLAGPTVNNQADLEEANAQSLKVEAIPTIFLNGRSVAGAQPREVFEKALTEELAYADAVLKAGVPPADLYNTITKQGAPTLANANPPRLRGGQGGAVDPPATGDKAGGDGATMSVFHAALKVLKDNEPLAKACYQESLALKPGLAGKVIVNVDLAAGQEPTVLLQESTMDFPKVDNCIVKALRTLAYTKPAGGEPKVRVRYLFTFPSERGDGRQ
jgi:RNA polymerase sigma factor (sigma-70 family)